MDNELKEIVADILDLDEDDISDELGPDNVDNWDSMNHLKLITAVEENFNIKLSMSEIQSIENFARLQHLIEEHLCYEHQ